MKSNLYKKDLITTKYAGKLSGYTSSYLRRLARSGEVEGVQVGRVWLIKHGSLARFLDAQAKRKEELSLARSRVRAEEYHAHLLPEDVRRDVPNLSFQDSRQKAARLISPPFTNRFLRTSKISPVVIQPQLAPATRRSPFFAFLITLLVLISSALAAQSAVVPQFTEKATTLAHDLSLGFNATFGNIPYDIALKIAAAKSEMQKQFAHVAQQSRLSFAYLELPATVDLSFVHLIPLETPTYSFNPDTLIRTPPPVLKILQLPALADVPGLIARMNLALGNSIITATHVAIHADVMLASGLATAAPESARLTVTLIGTTGDVLARATERVPALATTLFLRATEAPTVLAPALAQTAFNAEYAVATRFVAVTNTLSEQYLAFVNSTGELAYAGTTGMFSLALLETRFLTGLTRSAQPFLARVLTALEDAYLGMLGNGALAVNAITAEAPQVAAALAAAGPALSLGEQVALTTYETIQNFFDSAVRTFATIFAPLPVIVLPSGVPKPRVITVATSTPRTSTVATTSTPRVTTYNPQSITSNSYPTYTTVVQGVSQDVLNKSLAALRTDILATVTGQIQPIAAQGVTNMTTIQQVNMIQDLSNLIVRNGNFIGGTFSGGNLTNGISVGATTGNFGTLTAGPTTITGPISSSDQATAAYFTATSATATSTFAGGLTVGTNKLIIDLTTGNVGIGTTSPVATLGMQGSIGVNTTQLYLAGNGRIGIGTSTPDSMLSLLQTANGLPMISAYRATDSAPSGDFINYRTNSGTTLFRVDNSGNLLAGGIINTGSQTVTSTSQPQFRVQYDPNNEITTSVGSTGTTTIGVNGSAPALFFTPGSNRVNSFNFTNAGASNSILSIDTLNQRVGIGTTSPVTPLYVSGSNPAVAIDNTGSGSGNFPQLIFRHQSTNEAYIYWDQANNNFVMRSAVNNGSLSFGTNGPNERMRIDGATGNVGIGTTSPYAQFSIATPNGATGSLSTLFAISSSTQAGATTTLMTVLANGNVGIGTASPGIQASATRSFLTIKGSAGAGILELTSAQADADNVLLGYVSFIDSNAVSADKRSAIINVNLSGTVANNRGSYMAFNTKCDGCAGSFERMRIDNTGNVGIGTTTPAAKLDTYYVPGSGTGMLAEGSSNSTALNNDAAGLQLVNYGTTDNSYSTIAFGNRPGGFTSGISGVYVNHASGYGDLAFLTTGAVGGYSEKMRITNAGNVGIGTTTPQNLLSLVDAGSANMIDMSRSNAHWKILLSQNTTNDFTLRDALNSADRMTILNNGNVGIGTIAPGSPLEVVGTTNTSVSGITIRGNLASNALRIWTDATKGYINAPGQTAITSMAFDSTGNVGIGTTGPGAVLPNSFLSHATSRVLQISTGDAVSQNSSGVLIRRADNVTGLDLWNNAYNGPSYIDDRYDATGASLNFRMRTNGTPVNAMTILGTGYVGIGTPAPGYTLDVNGAINATSVLINGVAVGAGGTQWASGSGGVISYTGGNVGIGTTTPAVTLDVKGNVFVRGTGTISNNPGSGELQIGNGIAAAGTAGSVTRLAIQPYGWTGGPWKFVARDNSTKAYLDWVYGAATTGLTQDSSGLIGIGTTSPIRPLYISNSGAATVALDRTGSTGYASFDFRTASAAQWGTGLKPNDTGYQIWDATQSDTARIYIAQTTGNVGIGTTSPATKLTIVSGNPGSSYPAYSGVHLSSDGATNFTAYSIGRTGVDGYLAVAGVAGNYFVGSAPGDTIVQAATGKLLLGTGAVGAGTGMTISAGNVLVSTVANCNPIKADASGTLNCSSDERLKDISGTYITGLSAIDAINPILYTWKTGSGLISSGTVLGFSAQNVQSVIPEAVTTDARGFLQLSEFGVLAASVNAIKTLDSRTSFIRSATTSPVLSVDASGNVGIGTTTPNHTLTVAGDIAAIAFVNTSTRDAKSDITYTTASSSEQMLNQLVNLKVATYRYKIEDQNDPLRLGFIAEDAATIAPEILSPDGKGVDLYKLATFTLSGVQALAAKVDAQDTRLTSLETRMTALESGAISSASGSPFTLASSTEQITSWFANAGNGIGDLFAKTFHASEKICVDDQCLTKDDVRALLALEHPQMTGTVGTSGSSTPDTVAISATSTQATTTPDMTAVVAPLAPAPATIFIDSTTATSTIQEPPPVTATTTP